MQSGRKMPNLSAAPPRLSMNNGDIFRAADGGGGGNYKTERDLRNVNTGDALLPPSSPSFNLFLPALLTFPFTSPIKHLSDVSLTC